jgi:vacuolar protein 8
VAVGILRNLTDDPVNHAILLAAGALPPLVTLLDSRSVGLQVAAANALRNLARNVDNQVKIAAAGAISPLVALLGSSSVGVQVQAAGALRCLAANADNKVKIKVRQRPFLHSTVTLHLMPSCTQAEFHLILSS